MDEPAPIVRPLTRIMEKNAMAGDLAGVTRLTAGAASETWMFDLRDGDQSNRYILQRSSGDDAFAMTLPRPMQAAIQRACGASGVPVTDIVYVLEEEDGLGEGVISRFMAGETVPRRIQSDESFRQCRENFAPEVAGALAKIHAMDVTIVPNLPVSGTSHQVSLFDTIYRQSGLSLPVFDYAFAWIRDNSPTATPDTLVHGDFRLGNLMVSDRHLLAVLDWEMAHLGDPHEDIGWMMVKPWRFKRRDLATGGICTREAFCESYSKQAGRDINRERLRFWEVFGLLKWGIMCVFMVQQFLDGSVPTIERAAIGRRISETEMDLMNMLGKA